MGDDREELQAFFADNYKWLFAVALSLTGKHHHDAQELVGATAERMAKSWRQARSEDHSGWAATIMRNAWRDELRRRKRRPEVLSVTQTEVAGGLDPEHAIITREAFTAGLERMTRREWKVFVLHAHAELTFEQIGRRLHISRQSAQAAWSSAAKKLGAR